MFERFTDRARHAVVLAQEEARLLDHNYIGTEHILLGLVREGEGVAAQALAAIGISLDAVRAEVEEIIGRAGQVTPGHIPFTPRSKKVLELALREALQLGDKHIGTEHILLGLIREGQGVGAQVLVKLGADLARVRETVITLSRGYQHEGAVAPRQPGVWQKLPPGIFIASCSFCETASPDCGRLFVGRNRQLICETCVTTAAALLEGDPGDAPAEPGPG